MGVQSKSIINAYVFCCHRKYSQRSQSHGQVYVRIVSVNELYHRSANHFRICYSTFTDGYAVRLVTIIGTVYETVISRIFEIHHFSCRCSRWSRVKRITSGISAVEKITIYENSSSSGSRIKWLSEYFFKLIIFETPFSVLICSSFYVNSNVVFKEMTVFEKYFSFSFVILSAFYC